MSIEVSEKPAKNRPLSFGPSFKGDFPAEMRRQMWPLCCGMSIISGFKSVAALTEDQLVADIEYTCTTPRPDFQIFGHEQMRPAMTWLTLNDSQMSSEKVMNAIKRAGFVLVGTGRPRGRNQGLFLRDTSKTWTLAKAE